MIYSAIIVVLSFLEFHHAAPLAPSGGVDGSRWFEQMASAFNQPPKPGFQGAGVQPMQDPGVKQPFQDTAINQPQPNTPNQPNVAAQPPFSGAQQPKDPSFQQPSLFQLLFSPFFSDPDLTPQTQGFQNQQPGAAGQQTQGFGAGATKPEGMSGTGFQSQQPQPEGPNNGFQPNPPQPNGFQNQQPNAGFQPQNGPAQQPDMAQNEPAFDPIQSELSLFNNILKNFFMW